LIKIMKDIWLGFKIAEENRHKSQWGKFWFSKNIYYLCKTFGEYGDIYMFMSERTNTPNIVSRKKRFDSLKKHSYLCETKSHKKVFERIQTLWDFLSEVL
jgi:hypothetical protein